MAGLRGERIAFVSDAGTLAVSDPGAALVAAVSAAGSAAFRCRRQRRRRAALSVAGDAQAPLGLRLSSGLCRAV